MVESTETDPCDPDTDNDNLTDGLEVSTLGSDPLYWDTDYDGLPDKFEYDNRAASPPLDLMSPADGLADFDSDQNENAHEFWNGTPLRSPDPQGHHGHAQYGCAYWGEQSGDCWLGPPDLGALRNRIMGLEVDYSAAIPSNGQTHDLDADLSVGPPDLNIIRNMVQSSSVTIIGSSPTSLSVSYSPGGPVSAGDTTHVTITVHNANLHQSPGFAVEFSLDLSTTADVDLYGGDGSNTGHRYDFSSPSVSTSASTIILRPTSSGTIILNVRLPPCGAPGLGRNLNEVILSPPITITVTP
jgi:hypothetical protein